MSQLPIYVEVLNSAGEVRERVKITQLPATLGRAYDNDVILDDAFVAPLHARLERNQLDELLLIDQGTHNGIYRDNERLEAAVIDGHRPLTLGRTALRIRSRDFVVAPEAINAPSYRYTLWPWALLMLTVLGGLHLLKDWLYTPEPAELTDYLVSALSVPLAAVVGAGVFALIGKLFYGQARFILQLTLTAFFGLISGAISVIGHLASYSFNLPHLLTLTAVLGVGLSALAAYVQFRAMGNQRKWLLALVFGGIALAGIIFKASSNYQATHYLSGQIYMGHILPEALRVSGERSPSEFIEKAQSLQEKVDALREPKDTID